MHDRARRADDRGVGTSAAGVSAAGVSAAGVSAATGARVLCGLGGSLDVFAGNVERAPQFWRDHGLEWFYRLCKEPRRIGRMARLPLVLFQAAGARLTGGRARA